MKRGKFVTFEGGEGSGKSTQAALLAKRLGDQGVEVVLTREPGGTPFAELIREVVLNPEAPSHSALSEALLFYAARADHLEHVIRPALARGQWVLCDRFSDSTRVYQSLAGGLDTESFRALETVVVGKDRPDLTLIMDIDASLGLRRADRRREVIRDPSQIAQTSEGRDKFEGRDLAFHEKLRAGFRRIATEEPHRCVVIDADAAAEAVSGHVWDAVHARLLAGVH
jgi:dTMP kinase